MTALQEYSLPRDVRLRGTWMRPSDWIGNDLYILCLRVWHESDGFEVDTRCFGSLALVFMMVYLDIVQGANILIMHSLISFSFINFLLTNG
jgi:hypothetical protein